MNSTSKKQSKLILYVPSMFTTLNLLMGIIVIYQVIFDNLNAYKVYLPLLIVFAGFCDWLDGRVARKLNAETPFGKELDSFADCISFGLAPVTMVIRPLAEHAGILGILVSVTFPLAGIFRLVRFNINEYKGYYVGVPITAAGIILSIKHLIFIISGLQDRAALIDSYLTIVIMITLSILMVSRVKVKKI